MKYPSLITLNISKILAVTQSVFFSVNGVRTVSYKHITCIPRWIEVETFVSSKFQRGIHVVCF